MTTIGMTGMFWVSTIDHQFQVQLVLFSSLFEHWPNGHGAPLDLTNGLDPQRCSTCQALWGCLKFPCGILCICCWCCIAPVID